MARNRDAAYGAPQEEREVVVTVDRRLLAGGGLVLVGVLALGFGFWWARRGAGEVTTSPPNAAAGAVAQADAQATVAIRQTMEALDLPTSAQVVQPIIRTTELAPAPIGTAAPLMGDNPVLELGATLPAAQATMAQELGGQPFTLKEGRPDASNWDHDVLAKYENPNVTAKGYQPVLFDEIGDQKFAGPRLALSELNFINSFDYGKVPMDIPAAHDFKMTNVGDADLTVGRIYTGCGCTATRFGDVFLDNAGFLPTPMTLKPGQSQVFTVEFDPRAEGKAGAQEKFIQIFSSDPNQVQFSASDPLSHETRFRIVVQPAYEVKAQAGAKTFKVTKFGGDTAK